MGHVLQRFGLRFTRLGAVLVLLGAALFALGYWIGPFRPLPAELQVLAVTEAAPSDAVVATPQRDTVSGKLRFGVPLAVRNVGARAARPQRLLLSVPAYYRLTTRNGPLPSDVSPGVPLRRYSVEIEPAAPIPPDSTTHPLAGVDTVWIEPDLPSYYCSSQSGRVPDFLPAPPRRAETLSDLRIFYSVRTAQPQERHSGLLAVRVDPAALQTEPAPMPPAFPATFRDPEADAPQLGRLRYVGARAASCGDPEQPMELYTVVWQGQDGGRMYVVHVEGVARKRLYDVDRDDVIELETWDVDGDGRFEARREARFRVPEFLVPMPSRVADAWRPDSTPPDSMWLERFYDASRGPARFVEPLPRVAVAPAPIDSSAIVADSAAVTDTAGAVSEELSAEVDAARAAAPAPWRIIAPTDTAGVTRPSRAFLNLFGDTLAGPFRFSNAVAIDSATARAAADSIRRVRRPRRTEPLGVPIPYPRPDTLSRQQ